MNMTARFFANCFLMSTMLISLLSVAKAGEVNVYSYRQPQLIKPMFDVFTEQSGITVNAVYAKKGMLERLRSEGANSPADLVFTVDIGRLSDTINSGLTQSVQSEVLNRNIPQEYRDPDGHWFGLTSRARIIVTSKDRVASGEISTYEELVDPKWKGRICTRSGKHPYMVALTASIIVAHGIDSAKSWLQGLKNNLARKPQGNDRAQVKAIHSGECDVAVINHYYWAKMLADPEQVPWAESARVVFPNQEGRGTHMNVSGVALTKYSPNRENAIKLMEFLSSAKGQALYAEKNGEYPVSDEIGETVGFHNDLLASWGPFVKDVALLADIASNRGAAIRLADQVGYDF
jgi:iron(III) transport system substrate-binding protein